MEVNANINDQFLLVERECICAVCAHGSEIRFTACNEADLDCAACSTDCPCRDCVENNNFSWRGAWRDPVNDPPKNFVPVIVCREKSKGEYIVEQGLKDVGDWWKVYGTRIKAKSVIGWQPFPAAMGVE